MFDFKIMLKESVLIKVLNASISLSQTNKQQNKFELLKQ